MMRVYPLGLCRAGGGALFLLEGAPPAAGVVWTLSGTAGGTLTPLANATSGAGVALAKWNGTGATAGGTLTVGAQVYA